MESKTAVVGIYDDHDFGANDSNGHFSEKEITKNWFLDFVRESKDSERRTPGRGAFTSYVFGTKKKSVRMILLDVRYNKTHYWSEKHPDILGKTF